MNGLINNSSIIIKSPFIVEEHVNDFLRSIDIRCSSKNTYKRQLKVFVEWLKNQNVGMPNEQIIITYNNYLKNTKKLSDLTIKGYITAIKLFFAWLEATEIYPNIAKKIHRPKQRYGVRKDVLSSDQVKRILKAIDRTTLEGKRDFALINLMIWAGLRSLEIIRAMRGDLANCCGTHLLWIQEKGQDGKDEHIQLSDKIFNPIQEYLEARKSTSDTEPLFASHSTRNFGQSLTTRSISRIIKKRLQHAKINTSRISADSLRYTAITLNLLKLATAQQVNTMMSYAEINTMLMYVRLLRRRRVER